MDSVKRILRLTGVILKTIDVNISFSRLNKPTGKKGTSIAGVIVMLFVFAEIGFMVYFLSDSLYTVLSSIGGQAALLGYAAALFAFLTFFFGIFYIISVFYHSKDIEVLLSLPFKPWEIVGGKFLSILVFEYFTTALVLIPFFVYGTRNGEGPLFYVYSVIVMLLLPVVPLTLDTLIIMPVMRFVKVARNKDAFNIIAGICLLFLALGLNFGIQMLFAQNGQSGNIGGLIASGGEKMTLIGIAAFPGIFFAAQALAFSSVIWGFVYFLAFFICCAAGFMLVLLLANVLYIPAAADVTSSYATHKRLDSAEIEKKTAVSSSLFTYMKKDLLILFRTPIFFLNNVAINFLWPAFLLIALLIPTSRNSGEQLSVLVKSLDFSDGRIAAAALFIIFSAALVLGGTNGVTASCLSREGSNFNLMKYIPMSYFNQIMAKIAVGAGLSAVSFLLTFAIFFYLAVPPFQFTLLAVVVAVPAIAITNFLCIFLDLLWPKLHWDNEQKAVKQNLNVLFSIFIPLGLAVVIGYFGVSAGFSLWEAAGLLLLTSAVLLVILLIVLKKVIPILMNKNVY